MMSTPQYIKTYLQAQSDRASFLKNNPVDWKIQPCQEIVLWAFKSKDTDLIEHIVETVSENMVDTILGQIFEQRSNIEKSRQWAGHLLNRYPVNTDRVLLECTRHLDAEWMVLLAPFASDAVASKAYGTILHYVTPRAFGMDMWGKKLVNRFFDEHVELLLEQSLLNDPNGKVRWNLVLDDVDPVCDLSQRITSLLQNQQLHQEITNPTACKAARKI